MRLMPLIQLLLVLRSFGSSTSGSCILPHPVSPDHALEGADLHYKLSRYYSGDGPAPLEEVFFATQNLSRTVQDMLLTECPGLLITAFVMLAEARLPVAPAEAMSAIAKADQLAAGLSVEVYEAAQEQWPVQEALEGYRRLTVSLQELSQTTMNARPRVHMVVCHCKESLEWLSDGRYHLPSKEHVEVDLFVYGKCNLDAPRPLSDFHISIAPFSNVVRIPVQDGDVRRDECSAYLRHLIDQYNDPADFTLFFQADAGDHLQWEYLSLVLRAIELNSLETGFVHLNHPRLVASMSPCREEVFRQVFGRAPEDIGSYCCAQFAVSRDRVLANDLARYKLMHEMLYGESPVQCHDIPGHSTHCLMYEVYWHVLFGEPDGLPYRAENAALPLFLRIRDVENESYLPAGSLYLQLAAAPPEVADLDS